MYRYPGSIPFSRLHRKLFFGRKEDEALLARHISVNKLMVLHGKSGLGKSSLLNAGLIPRMEEEYGLYPVFVRLGSYQEGKPASPLYIFSERLRAELGSFESPLDAIESADPSLWQYAKSLELARPEHRGLLLIFDQFEELFSYPEAGVRLFKEELAELLHDRMPELFRLKLQQAVKKGLAPQVVAAARKPLPLKVVLSLRSDRLSELEQLSSTIPAILHNRYELLPMDPEEAREAIEKPAEMEQGEFESPPFCFHPAATQAILEYLTKDKRRSIEPFQLQLICHEAEQKVMSQQLKEVKPEDLGDLRQITEAFIQRVLGQVPGDQRLQVQRLLEEGLILEEEQRRLQLDEGVLLHRYEISPDLLKLLVDQRLLRRESSADGTYSYELSHDTLVAPLLREKRERKAREAAWQWEEERKAAEAALKEERRRRRRLALLAGAAGLGLLLSLLALGYALRQQQLAEQQKRVARSNELWQQAINQEEDHPASFRLARQALAENPDNLQALGHLWMSAYEPVTQWQDTSYGPPFYKRFVGKMALSSPQGRYLLTQPSDRSLSLHDLQKNSSRQLGPFSTAINHVSFSPDEKLLALSLQGDSLVRLLNLQGQVLRQFAQQGACQAALFSPDGRYLSTDAKDGTQRLWTVEGDSLAVFSNRSRQLLAREVAFSPDTQYLLVAARDDLAELYSLSSQQKRFAFEVEGIMRQAAFLEGGKKLMILSEWENGSGNLQSRLTLFDLTSGSRKALFSCQNQLVRVAAEGNLLAVAWGDSLRVWEQGKRKEIVENTYHRHRERHEGGIRQLAFSPDGKQMLTVGKDHQVLLWEVESCRLIARLSGHQDEIVQLGFGPRSRHMLSVSSDQVVRYWQPYASPRRKLPHSRGVYDLHFQVEDGSLLSLGRDRKARLWSLEGKPQKEQPDWFREDLMSFAQAEDRRVGLLGKDSLWLWEKGSAKLLNPSGLLPQPQRVMISKNGKRILAWNREQLVMWNEKGEQLAQLSVQGSLKAFPAAISKEGDGVALLLDQSRCLRWDGKSAQPQVHDLGAGVTAFAFDPKGGSLQIGTAQGQLFRWPKGAGQPSLMPIGHAPGKRVTSLACSADGRFLASAGLDEKVLLWDLQSQTLQDSLEHEASVWSLAFAPNQAYLLSGSGNGALTFWDLLGNQIAQLTGHQKLVNTLRFSADGRYLATAGADGYAMLWVLDPALLARLRKYEE
jgi:WD40 repeat protein